MVLAFGSEHTTSNIDWGGSSNDDVRGGWNLLTADADYLINQYTYYSNGAYSTVAFINFGSDTPDTEYTPGSANTWETSLTSVLGYNTVNVPDLYISTGQVFTVGWYYTGGLDTTRIMSTDFSQMINVRRRHGATIDTYPFGYRINDAGAVLDYQTGFTQTFQDYGPLFALYGDEFEAWQVLPAG